MAVTDFFAGEIATELLKVLVEIARKSALCKASAEQLISSIQVLLPVIQEIKYSGVELPPERQRQLDGLSETLRTGLELAAKVRACRRWNVYKNFQMVRKMEKLEKTVSRFLKGPMQAHVLADVHHLRFESAERFDRLEGSARRLEQRLGSLKIGASGEGSGCGWWLEEAAKRVEGERCEDSLENLGRGIVLAKRKVKEMVIGRDDLKVVGICGIGGSGKTTLAREISRDNEVRSYFNSKVFFLTVSQSPDVEHLRLKIWGMITGHNMDGSSDVIPQWMLQHELRVVVKTLVILDDVWSLPVLEQLICRIPGCKTLVVSRFKFSPSIINCTYELELLKEEEALSLFCNSAFGQKSIPLGANQKLINQVVDECKGLPLAIKVIGASLRDQTEMFWMSAKNRLSRSQPICESHEIRLLERMKLSTDYLSEKVRECFLDLGSFPEDKRIPLDILISIWVELHDIDAAEAFAILVELADKNLLTLVKDSRSGEYSSYYDICVSQHDVLRDLALHLSNCGTINQRRRLLMPRRENGIPKEWERNIDKPFDAQLVSVHTGEMREMDWFCMECPKAEVLILNFSSSEYFLPSFIENMPKLRALVLINHSTSNAILHNLSVLTNLSNLTSIWFEKISVPQFPQTTIPFKNLQKMSLVLCKINNSLDLSVVDLPHLFPRLSELTIDHCVDLSELPPSICQMHRLTSLSVTNCHSLHELPSNLGKLTSLQILRIYASPSLRKLPPGICSLVLLEYLDISQCVNLECLPEGIGGLARLEKIDMRECPQITSLPKSAAALQCLRRVICDEELSWSWKDVEIPNLSVQVAEQCFNLDWLAE
ncbi:probable disease resistance protein At4g33300 [Diospyros lotus]|uniref:probable disease resistance protein At4g33300 n=1 Tax=Diospyros lotus TaxID=55363 RepID=UPI0022538364|nr:probable disease resistance protein At4g33300 [Diospyros lotus]